MLLAPGRRWIRLCGPVTFVPGGGTPVAVKGTRAQVVAARLVLDRHGHGTTRDQLAETVWPDGLPDTWPPALRGLVSRVRKALTALGDDTAITFDDQRYALRLPPEVGVDLDVVLDTLDRVATAPVDEVSAALDLLRRPFLEAHDDPWASGVRTTLHRRLVDGLLALSDRSLASGDLQLAVATAQEALAAAPLSDGAVRRAMTAHAAGGGRDRALDVYTRFRALLEQDLGVRPEPATEELYLSLLGDGSATGPRSPRPEPVVVGRAGVLEQADRLWRRTLAGVGGSLRVHGEPGIGKSTLLDALVRRLGADATHVVYCSPTPDAAPALATALRRIGGDRPGSTREAIASALHGLTGDGPTLVLVDDVDRLDDVSCGALRILTAPGYRPDRLMLVSASLRPDDAAGATTGRTAHHWSWVEPLTPLGLHEMHDLMRALDVHPTDTARLLEDSGGNPLLLTLLSSPDDPDQTAAAVGAHVQRLLAGLSPTARTFLHAAAVAGRAFEVDVVARLADLPAGELHPVLDELSTAHLVVDTTLVVGVPAVAAHGHRFVHGVVRDTLRTRMSRIERTALERRLADVVLVEGVGDAELYAEAFAPAVHRTGEHATRQRAAAGILAAAATAAGSGDHGEAVRMLRVALDLVGAGNRHLECQVHLALGKVLLSAADPGGASHLLEATGLAIAAGEWSTAMEAASCLDAMHRLMPDVVEAPDPVFDLVGESLQTQHLDPSDPVAARFLAGLVRRRRHAVQEPLLTGAAAGLRRALDATLDPLAGPARLRLAEDLWSVASAADRHDDLLLAAHHGLAAGTIGADRASVERFGTLLHEAAALPGAPAVARELLDDLADVRAFVDGAPAAGRTSHGTRARRRRLVAAWLGLDPVPRPDGPPPPATPLTGPDDGHAARVDPVLTAVLSGNLSVARQQLRVVLASMPERTDDATLHSAGVLALAAGQLGDCSAMERILDRLTPLAALMCGDGYRTSLGPVALHLGRLHHRLGSVHDAEAYLTSAQSRAAAAGQPLWLAVAQLEHAALLAGTGRPGDAQTAALLEDEAHRLLPALAGTPRLPVSNGAAAGRRADTTGRPATR